MNRQMIFLTAILFAAGIKIAPAQQQTGDILFYQLGGDPPAQGTPANTQDLRFETRRITGVGPDVLFMGSEFLFEGKPVKGAPYSAESVNETVQTLADGNRIIQSSTSKVYRDREGRTRRESDQSSSSPGPFFFRTFASAGGGDSGAEKGFAVAGEPVFNVRVAGPGAIPHPQILITDPVAGVNYMLDPNTRTAQKMSASMVSAQDPAIAAAIAKAKQDAESTGQGSATINTDGKRLVINMKKSTNEKSPLAPVTESLGTQTIEGVECEGTRTTLTIPAGEIGNELPIVITNERWYSSKLQTDVLSKRHDPRTGDTTFKLVNINQSEPPASLFQVPADYTIVDMAERTRTIIEERESSRK